MESIPADVLRGRIARIIAATRFPFVDQEDWDESRVTIANVPGEEAWGFDRPEGRVYPSVVVLHADGRVRELGEVEMESCFTEEHVERWRLLSEKTGPGVRYKKFFLYVPVGGGEEARRLLEENGIEYAGLRTWAIKEGNLVTSPVRTPDMPKDHRTVG